MAGYLSGSGDYFNIHVNGDAGDALYRIYHDIVVGGNIDPDGIDLEMENDASLL